MSSWWARTSPDGAEEREWEKADWNGRRCSQIRKELEG